MPFVDEPKDKAVVAALLTQTEIAALMASSKFDVSSKARLEEDVWATYQRFLKRLEA